MNVKVRKNYVISFRKDGDERTAWVEQDDRADRGEWYAFGYLSDEVTEQTFPTAREALCEVYRYAGLPTEGVDAAL